MAQTGKRAHAVAIWAGSLGLIGAALVDFCGVISRHLQHPISGTIELVRCCIVLVVSCAMVAATFTSAHAAVHLLIDRLSGRAKLGFKAQAAAWTALLFLLLFVASFWLLIITYGTDEKTDLLSIPLLPFRAILCLSLAVAFSLSAVKFAAIMRECIKGEP